MNENNDANPHISEAGTMTINCLSIVFSFFVVVWYSSSIYSKASYFMNPLYVFNVNLNFSSHLSFRITLME